MRCAAAPTCPPPVRARVRAGARLLALAALGHDRPAGARARRRAAGPADLGRARVAGADLVRSGRDLGDHHAVHDAVRAARCDGEADAGQPAGAEPGRVVGGVEGRAALRFRAARRRQIPQRRSGHGRGRQVFVRALSRRLARGVQEPGRLGRDARCAACAVHAEGAMARFSDLLRQRYRRRLGRAEEICRKGRRRRLQEAPDRGRPVQVRLVQPGCRADAGGVRGFLAQDARASSAW